MMINEVIYFIAITLVLSGFLYRRVLVRRRSRFLSCHEHAITTEELPHTGFAFLVDFGWGEECWIAQDKDPIVDWDTGMISMAVVVMPRPRFELIEKKYGSLSRIRKSKHF